MDFIKTKHVDLIQRMGKTICMQIVDDCYSKNILGPEERDLLYCEKVAQEAARQLITIIEKKGASAISSFVESLKQHDFYLYEDLQGRCSAKEATQHSLDLLAEDLKELYTSACFQKFHPLGEDIDILFDLETTFTDAVFWKKDTMNNRKGHVTLTKLLGEFKNPSVIEGEAGKGKTTLLKRVAALWASGECPALKKFRLVFFISLSGAKGGIYDTVCEQLLRVPYDIEEEAFKKALWKLKEEVLFLLDGYDEFKPENCPEMESLIKEKRKFKNMVVVTTRTETVKMVRNIAETVAEIGDLSEEGAKVLIENVLKPELAIDLLLQLKESSTMQELMKTPLFVVISCAIRMGETNIIPKTQTALFCTLYDLMVEKNRYKTQGLSCSLVLQSINNCGDLALNGIFEQQFSFSLGHLLSEQHEKVLLAAGLLNKYTSHVLNPVYRFFHKSFQEYIAGRRLHALLTSSTKVEVEKGFRYLCQIDNISDINNKYHNLLLYTCGSSKKAAKLVIQHMANIHNHGSLMGISPISDMQSVTSDNEEAIDPQNLEELQKLQEMNLDRFVVCALNFFSESHSESELSEDFEVFFCNKRLHISNQSIPSYLFDFFKYLPNCLEALSLITLELFGTNISPEIGTLDKKKTFIPEQAVPLFYDWSHSINTMQVSLKDFQMLPRKDRISLGKICSSALSLRLHITRSSGISGKLQDILKRCEQNIHELVIEATPLTLADEQQVVLMKHLKTLYISDLQTERLEGGFIDRIQNLQNIKKLTLNNIKMAESDVKQLAEGMKHLKMLTVLHLSQLTGTGNGLISVIEAATSAGCRLEVLELVDCCLTKEAVTVLVQNLTNLQKLQVLDLSQNHLEEYASDCVGGLVDGLRNLPSLHTLMLPWGKNVKDCLIKLLEQLPGLRKLGLQKWCITDENIELLTSSIKKGGFKDLQHLDLADNCVSSKGWHSFLGAMEMLRRLEFVDLSSKEDLDPEPRLIRDLGKLVSDLSALQEVGLLQWKLDENDLMILNKGKTKYGREFNLRVTSEKVNEDEEDEEGELSS